MSQEPNCATCGRVSPILVTDHHRRSRGVCIPCHTMGRYPPPLSPAARRLIEKLRRCGVGEPPRPTSSPHQEAVREAS